MRQAQMRRFVLRSATTIIVALGRSSQPRLEMLEAGIFEISSSQSTLNENLPDGRRLEIDDFELIEATQDVSARVGTVFGIVYSYSGPPKDCPFVTERIVPPSPGIVDQRSGKRFSEIVEDVSIQEATEVSRSIDTIIPGRLRPESGNLILLSERGLVAVELSSRRSKHAARRITSECRRTSLGQARLGLRRPRSSALRAPDRAARAGWRLLVYLRQNSLATARR